MTDGQPWPKITIVTPSFNQGAFLEETLRSVLLQQYPNLEYIVIDGGSTDQSANIIQKYAPWLAHWESTKDRGQSHAINKGFARATGEVFAWLNSDDIYEPGILTRIAAAFRTAANPDIVYGDCVYVNSANTTIVGCCRSKPFDEFQMWTGNFIPQPSSFLKTAVIKNQPLLMEKLHYCLDYALWLDLHAQGCRFEYLPVVMSRYRLHDASKTVIHLDLMQNETLDRIFLPRLVQNPEPAVRAAMAASVQGMVAQAYHELLTRQVLKLIGFHLMRIRSLPPLRTLRLGLEASVGTRLLKRLRNWRRTKTQYRAS